ncbi:unnamed protein product, partial [Ectocarpus sp. 4 AP-2014]
GRLDAHGGDARAQGRDGVPRGGRAQGLHLAAAGGRVPGRGGGRGADRSVGPCEGGRSRVGLLPQRLPHAGAPAGASSREGQEGDRRLRSRFGGCGSGRRPPNRRRAAGGPFRVSTLVHFLLPLALHPLHEAAKSSEAGLVGQAVQLVGAIARHLPWTHYNSALRGLMQQVAGAKGESDSHSPEKERAMIGAVCQVLDGFHFALIPPGVVAEPAAASAAAEPSSSTAVVVSNGGGAAAPAEMVARGGDAVWRAVNDRLLGSLRSLLVKEVRGKSGGKEKVLRAAVAVGMLNLIRRLPADAFELQLKPLLMTVCQSLKSRDSNARDTARDTLAKMARDLGPDYLQQVITELRTCLVTGYQLHVRTFTLHTVLKTVADSYKPPNPPSVDVRKAGPDEPDESASLIADTDAADAAPSFDSCIPEVVELLMEDLFGESAAAKEVSA